jgi:hypothetical protein
MKAERERSRAMQGGAMGEPGGARGSEGGVRGSQGEGRREDGELDVTMVVGSRADLWDGGGVRRVQTLIRGGWAGIQGESMQSMGLVGRSFAEADSASGTRGCLVQAHGEIEWFGIDPVAVDRPDRRRVTGKLRAGKGPSCQGSGNVATGPTGWAPPDRGRRAAGPGSPVGMNIEMCET